MQQAYLLHSRAYRETSQLLDFLSYDAGRIQLVGRGLKGNKKKSPVQLFVPYDIEYKGKGELKSLTQYEPVRGRMMSSSQGLQGLALYCGFYINEVLTRLLPKEQSLTDVFLLYQEVTARLMVLNDMPSIQVALRQFELQLLDVLGYGYDYACDANGQTIEAACHYSFVPNYGFVAALKADAATFLGADIVALNNQQFSDAQLAMAKRFTRLALAQHIGDKPLKSRELFI